MLNAHRSSEYFSDVFFHFLIGIRYNEQSSKFVSYYISNIIMVCHVFVSDYVIFFPIFKRNASYNFIITEKELELERERQRDRYERDKDRER